MNCASVLPSRETTRRLFVIMAKMPLVMILITNAIVSREIKDSPPLTASNLSFFSALKTLNVALK